MASLPKSQPCSIGPVCLSLLKFSHATVPIDSVAPVPWTHLASKNNLFVIFETTRTRGLDGQVEERKLFKVLRDPEVMEELDLEILAGEAQQAIAVSKDAHQHNRDQNVAIIVKAPVIAMKYPLMGGQVRRFQIRFAGDEDYYEAMKMLSRAQVPTIEAGTFPNRPHTATSSSTKNGTEHQNAVARHPNNRPVTAAPALGTLNQDSNSLPRLHQTSEAIQRPAIALMLPPSHFSGPAKHSMLSNQLIMHQSDKQWAYSIENIEPQYDQTLSTVQKENRDPQQRSIDLYTPRPSGAPVTTSQHFSQLLPPRRELPFEKSKPISSVVSTRILRSTNKETVEPEATSGAKQADVEKPKKRPLRKATSTASQSSTQKRKRNIISSKVNNGETISSAVKKGRNNQTGAAKTPKDDSPVPSIQETLKNHAATSIVGEHGNEKMDTQALLSRAEKSHDSRPPVSINDASVTSRGSNCEQLNFGLDVPSTSRVEVASSNSVLPHVSPSKLPTNTPPCTPANKIINPSNPSAPVDQHTIDTLPDPTHEPNPFPTLANAYACLLKHSAFANSDEKISAWAALQEDQQREAIRTFMCEQYANPVAADGFRQLCKVLETTWDRFIVWPDVYKGVS